MFLYQGKKIGGPAYPDGWVTIDGNSHPINLWNDPAMRALYGVVLAADIPMPDPRLYDSTENEDGTWTQTDRDPAVIAAEDAAAAQKAQDLADAQAARQYAKLQTLAGMTPAQIQEWVDANVTDLASAKDALKTLAVAVGVLARRL